MEDSFQNDSSNYEVSVPNVLPTCLKLISFFTEPSIILQLPRQQNCYFLILNVDVSNILLLTRIDDLIMLPCCLSLQDQREITRENYRTEDNMNDVCFLFLTLLNINCVAIVL